MESEVKVSRPKIKYDDTKRGCNRNKEGIVPGISIHVAIIFFITPSSVVAAIEEHASSGFFPNILLA